MAFKSDPVKHHFPGGENPVLAADRVAAALDDATAADPLGHILIIITHSTAIRLALCRLLKIPLKNYRRSFPSLGNCTLTTIRIKNGRTGLLRYNAPFQHGRDRP